MMFLKPNDFDGYVVIFLNYELTYSELMTNTLLRNTTDDFNHSNDSYNWDEWALDILSKIVHIYMVHRLLRG